MSTNERQQEDCEVIDLDKNPIWNKSLIKIQFKIHGIEDHTAHERDVTYVYFVCLMTMDQVVEMG